jgi:hypothetical protein
LTEGGRFRWRDDIAMKIKIRRYDSARPVLTAELRHIGGGTGMKGIID